MADLVDDVRQKFNTSDVLLPRKVDAINNEIIVFFSFDLVDSTNLKNISSTDWVGVVQSFYNITSVRMHKYNNNVQIWKYIGDEVLFYLNLSDLSTSDEIFELPSYVLGVQESVSSELDTICSEKKFDNYTAKIKSTIWIAAVTNNKDELPRPYINVRIETSPNTDSAVYDFLGPDIDIGFRLAKHAQSGKVTLYADFGLLIFNLADIKRKSSIDNQYKIVFYDTLKGVWNNRYYPIIWYHDNLKVLEKTFLYDDFLSNPLVYNYFAIKKSTLSDISKIYEDLGKTDMFNALLSETKKIIEDKKEDKQNQQMIITVNDK